MTMDVYRWMGRLRQQDKGGRLRAIICANRGYIPHRVRVRGVWLLGPPYTLGCSSAA